MNKFYKFLKKAKEIILRPSVIYLCVISIFVADRLYHFDSNFIDKSKSAFPVVYGILSFVIFAPLFEEFIFRYWINAKRSWLRSLTIITAIIAFSQDVLGLLYRYTNLGNADKSIIYTIGLLEKELASVVDYFISLSGFDHVIGSHWISLLLYNLSFLAHGLVIYLIWKAVSKLKFVQNTLINIKSKLPSLNIWWQIAISGFVFSVVHLSSFEYYFSDWARLAFFYFCMGLALGVIRIKHGIWAAIALHSLWNSIFFIRIYNYTREELIYNNGFFMQFGERFYIRDYYYEIIFYYIVLALTFTASISYLTYKTFFEKRQPTTELVDTTLNSNPEIYN